MIWLAIGELHALDCRLLKNIKMLLKGRMRELRPQNKKEEASGKKRDEKEYNEQEVNM